MLKSIFLLVDIRHAPNKNDIQMYEFIKKSGYEPVIIMTKLDKIKRSQVGKQQKLIRDTLGVSKDSKIFSYSSLSKQGRDEIYDYIDSVILESQE